MTTLKKQLHKPKQAVKKMQSRFVELGSRAEIYELFLIPYRTNDVPSELLAELKKLEYDRLQVIHKSIENGIGDLIQHQDELEQIDFLLRDLTDDIPHMIPKTDKFMESAVSRWLAKATQYEALAKHIMSMTAQTINGLEQLQRNIAEWEAALNPRYDMDGEMLAIHERAVADMKAGRVHRGLPTVTDE